MLLPKVLGEHHSGTLPASGSRHSLACGHIVLTSASVFTGLLLYVSLTPLLSFPGGTGGKKIHLPMQETWVPSLSGRSPGGGRSLQYSCLENPMDRRGYNQ